MHPMDSSLDTSVHRPGTIRTNSTGSSSLHSGDSRYKRRSSIDNSSCSYSQQQQKGRELHSTTQRTPPPLVLVTHNGATSNATTETTGMLDAPSLVRSIICIPLFVRCCFWSITFVADFVRSGVFER